MSYVEEDSSKCYGIREACWLQDANNHIFFDSGITILAVVQKLKKTPTEMIFEVIQKIVGSPINPENFQTFNGEYFFFSMNAPL